MIDPHSGFGPAVQASNFSPAEGNNQALVSPFELLSFTDCYLCSKGPYVFVGMGLGNGYHVVDTTWGMGNGGPKLPSGQATPTLPFDATSVSALSEYSDSRLRSVNMTLEKFVVDSDGNVVHAPIANGFNTTLANPYVSSAQITGPTGPFTLSGIAAGWDGQVLEIVNMSTQTMTILSQDDIHEPTPANRFTYSPAGGFPVLPLPP